MQVYISIARPKTGDIRANLLRGVVVCGHCGDSLTSMIIDKKDKQTKQITESRYYYKCENDECEMFGKSARAKYVLDVARAFFRQYLFVTEDNYDEPGAAASAWQQTLTFLEQNLQQGR